MDISENAAIVTDGVPSRKALDFTASCLDGSAIRLGELRGKKVWLTFFHFIECPVCRFRAGEMINRYPGWANPEFELVAVFHTEARTVKRLLGIEATPFPLVCDPLKDLYLLYGLGYAGVLNLLHPGYVFSAVKSILGGIKPPKSFSRATSLPGDFLINPDGSLHHSYFGTFMGDHIPTGRVEEWLGFKLSMD